MSSFNQVNLLGNLGQNPEVVNFRDGGSITRFSVATSERWVDKSGEWQERTEWHTVVLHAKTAEIYTPKLQKGTKVFVTGSIRSKRYTDKNGVVRTAFEIHADSLKIISGGVEQVQNQQASQQAWNQQQAPQQPQQAPQWNQQAALQQAQQAQQQWDNQQQQAPQQKWNPQQQPNAATDADTDEDMPF